MEDQSHASRKEKLRFNDHKKNQVFFNKGQPLSFVVGLMRKFHFSLPPPSLISPSSLAILGRFFDFSIISVDSL
ncbi:hypothetical protein DY000_02055872 [Brassica cretica]|uniref:Uncharacterized protein n=2 Tax=Brassica TaxID=3705 RepID=A0ABQ7ABP8_BRACR|nr:hypothetical protein DY000_02055872 [Brassica cretica]